MSTKRSIVFYRSESGNCPVDEFVSGLSPKTKRKVLWVLALVRDLAVVPPQYFKKLVGTDDLWEVRVQYGGDCFRFLGFWDGAKLIVLCHGFQKKTQQTPFQEIAVAGQRRRDYLKRKNGHG